MAEGRKLCIQNPSKEAEALRFIQRVSITMWMYGDVLPLLVLRLQFCMESLEMAPYFEVLVWIWDGQGLFSGIPIAMNSLILDIK